MRKQQIRAASQEVVERFASLGFTKVGIDFVDVHGNELTDTGPEIGARVRLVSHEVRYFAGWMEAVEYLENK
jgi:hypothetical protein